MFFLRKTWWVFQTFFQEVLNELNQIQISFFSHFVDDLAIFLMNFGDDFSKTCKIPMTNDL